MFIKQNLNLRFLGIFHCSFSLCEKNSKFTFPRLFAIIKLQLQVAQSPTSRPSLKHSLQSFFIFKSMGLCEYWTCSLAHLPTCAMPDCRAFLDNTTVIELYLYQVSSETSKQRMPTVGRPLIEWDSAPKTDIELIAKRIDSLRQHKRTNEYNWPAAACLVACMYNRRSLFS